MQRDLWRQFLGQSVEGGYTLRALIGAGSFGGVFRAEHVVAGQLVREVAVKLVLPDEARLAYQLPELIRGTNLYHAHVIRYFSAGEIRLNDILLLYIIMELAREGSLEQRLSNQTLSMLEVEELALQTASALAYLHAQPLVHRDVKPGNILRTVTEWKLSDLGTLRDTSATVSRTQIQFGSLRYMPPESFEGEVSPAWDLWSLGVVLVQALTGQAPFTASSESHLRQEIATEKPKIPDNLPRSLEPVIRGCLIADPRRRWTARQVIGALEETRAARTQQEFRNACVRAHDYLRARQWDEFDALLKELKHIAPDDPNVQALEREAVEQKKEQARIADLRRTLAGAVSVGDDERAIALFQDLYRQPPGWRNAKPRLARRRYQWLTIAVAVIIAGGSLFWGISGGILNRGSTAAGQAEKNIAATAKAAPEPAAQVMPVPAPRPTTVSDAPPTSSKELPQIVFFTASKASVSLREFVTLSWKVTGADSISISPGLGSLQPTGRTPVLVFSNYRTNSRQYTLTAKSQAGTVSKSVVLYLYYKSAPTRSDSIPVKPDASEVKPDASEVKPDASEVKPDTSEVKPDASDESKPYADKAKSRKLPQSKPFRFPGQRKR
jgi:serine/threonine protein kinase